MKYIASDGWKPKITFTNSFFEYLSAVIVGLILGKIAFYIISPFAGNDPENIKMVGDVTNVFLIIFAVWAGTKAVRRKLIKRHEEEIAGKNSTGQMVQKMSESTPKELRSESFCTKCGTKHDINSRFCTKCGNKLI